MKKTFKVLLIITLFLAIGGVITYLFIPKIAKSIFDKGKYVSDEKIVEYRENVSVQELEYSKGLKLDIIKLKNSTGLEPTLFWVHGGGFVGGDKSQMTDYLITLANGNINIVNINYSLVPKKYPQTLIDLGSSYTYIFEKKIDLGINLSNVYFGGDSAGAHIALQFTTVQTNAEYAKLVGIEPVITETTIIKGQVLFSGFYSVEAYKKSPFYIKIVWGKVFNEYYGRGWKTNDALNVYDYVNEKTVKTFLSDGNQKSFIEETESLSIKLLDNNVDVKKVVFEEKLGHNFMFNLDNVYSQNVLTELKAFII